MDDDRAHLKGNCEIEEIGAVGEDSVKVTVSFRGLTLKNLNVPKSLVLNSNGVSMYKIEDSVFIDCVMEEETFSKSFNDNTYTRSNLRVKRVVEFKAIKKQ